jgi:glycosyltransferase involved in cell wall biosynthesis
MRIALVTSGFDDPWCERARVTRRIASALSFHGSVDVLLANGATEPLLDSRGGVRLWSFPSLAADPRRREALHHAIYGGRHDSSFCRCDSAHDVDAAAEAPRVLQEELLKAGGGYSPALFEHLAATPYLLVMFADCRAATTVYGTRAVGRDTRVALLPFADDDSAFALPVVAECVARAERVLVVTETERDLVARHFSDGDERTRSIGFVLRTSELAAATEPPGFDGRRFVLVIGDWRRQGASGELGAAVAALRRSGCDLAFRAFGPGAEHFAGGEIQPIVATRGRIDLWRWMSRALAVLDWELRRLLARDVLEAMLSAIPVVVHESAGTAREHAERANGGVWYRTHAELAACLRAISEGSVRERLGAQGRAYAEARYGSSDAFIAAVGRAIGTASNHEVS